MNGQMRWEDSGMDPRHQIVEEGRRVQGPLFCEIRRAERFQQVKGHLCLGGYLDLRSTVSAFLRGVYERAVLSAIGFDFLSILAFYGYPMTKPLCVNCLDMRY